MTGNRLALFLALLLAIAALTPPAQAVVDYIYNSYLVMSVQMDGLRFWCL